MRTVQVAMATAIVFLVAGSQTEVAGQFPEAWIVSQAQESSHESGPFAFLLNQRGELALTSEQVASIQALQRRLLRVNEPLVAQLRDAELWGVTEEREVAALVAVRQDFEANTIAAEREALAVLTSEQRDAAKALLKGASLAYGTREGERFSGVEAADDSASPGSENKATATTVRVDNLGFNDATVYVYHGEQRERLGFVTGLTMRTFDIPARLIFGGTGLRFRVEAIARTRSVESNEIRVSPGDEVFLRIPPR